MSETIWSSADGEVHVTTFAGPDWRSGSTTSFVRISNTARASDVLMTRDQAVELFRAMADPAFARATLDDAQVLVGGEDFVLTIAGRPGPILEDTLAALAMRSVLRPDGMVLAYRYRWIDPEEGSVLTGLARLRVDHLEAQLRVDSDDERVDGGLGRRADTPSAVAHPQSSERGQR